MRSLGARLSPRGAGVLLHLTSLPAGPGQGPLGQAAVDVLDFLAQAGVTVWQMLPVHPVHADRSPYQALSVHAGAETLLCPQLAARLNGLDLAVPPAAMTRAGWLQVADQFLRQATPAQHAHLAAFQHEHRHWLAGYALFRALRDHFDGVPWPQWPAPWHAATVAGQPVPAWLTPAVQRESCLQYFFDQQWQALRQQADVRGIRLMGDIPMFPAIDSADVWQAPQGFHIHARGEPTELAGAPPDAFAPQGQRWSAAVCNWVAMAHDGYAWWVERLRTQARWFDLLRLDHFRGFVAYWSLDPGDHTAARGQWRAGPGLALFERLAHCDLDLQLVAEDLGTITDDVEALRDTLRLPGMRVLQFAFDGSPRNIHLPARHPRDCVAYTGTHDNDTLLGWWATCSDAQRECVWSQLGRTEGSLPWDLIEALLDSPASLAVVPAQDLLGLDSTARMNRPGHAHGNWDWRMPADALTPALGRRLRRALGRSARLP